ncbi:RNA polymerase sigma-70 factor [Tenggerimyces flavus]|uniref:RNA polymerase sigma-70 factor n=1 Tax=Tenggerimyces flavus TaxID=1708749 RepID=A0ABV7Y3M0_9ACTN|nr:RNA polymerase sigma-70 factor [Tenggerimyces flavus]MBM7790732.1 RNA polymerase sigma-70 factor (ECF subfamily) [Tenggerimyces flavus]
MTNLAADLHDELRPLMFSIAYRMLGSVAEAEDIVQEAFLRLVRSQPHEVESPEAYATTVTTRLAIDHLRSARVRREQYVGAWLPEPLLDTSAMGDPAAHAETADTVSLAFLVLLESLTPVERAVFLLREVFGYDYDRIAAIVEKTEANCRQIFVRAQRRLASGESRFEASPARRDELARQFFAAAESGDIAGLERMLAEDVAFVGDGGGKAPALATPAVGRTRVARFVLGIFRTAKSLSGRIEPTLVNGHPGARIVDADGNLAAVLALQIADGQIVGFQNVLNPDKLAHLGPLIDPSLFPGNQRPAR